MLLIQRLTKGFDISPESLAIKEKMSIVRNFTPSQYRFTLIYQNSGLKIQPTLTDAAKLLNIQFFSANKVLTMPHSAPKSSRFPAKRRELLLKVSREIFFEEGVGHATIDMIATRSGISKATIYRHYANKKDLFAAVISQAVREMTAKLSITLDPDDPLTSLRQAAFTIRNAVSGQGDSSSLYVEVLRQLIAELPRQFELCQEWYRYLVKELSLGLTDFFDLLIHKGQMIHSHSGAAATTFVLMAGGGFRPLFRALFSEEEEKKRLEADLEMFFLGCNLRSGNRCETS